MTNDYFEDAKKYDSEAVKTFYARDNNEKQGCKFQA